MGNERSVEMDDHHSKIDQHIKELEAVKKRKMDKQVKVKTEIDRQIE